MSVFSESIMVNLFSIVFLSDCASLFSDFVFNEPDVVNLCLVSFLIKESDIVNLFVILTSCL